jgi:hypothetical protein
VFWKEGLTAFVAVIFEQQERQTSNPGLFSLGLDPGAFPSMKSCHFFSAKRLPACGGIESSMVQGS